MLQFKDHLCLQKTDSFQWVLWIVQYDSFVLESTQKGRSFALQHKLIIR